VPSALHGRREEEHLLKQAYRRVRRGASELVLLTGRAGIGKTALAETLDAVVEVEGGIFARGWFDPFHGAPHSGIRIALANALQARLDHPSTDRVALRETLQAALGDGAGVVFQLVPELERVLGAVPEPEPVTSAEEQNRIRLLTRRLIGALAMADSPLVLLVDDLQWADRASVDLLAELVGGRALDHVLVVAGFRLGHDESPHRLLELAADPPAGGMPIHRVELAALEQTAARELVADALGARVAETRPLADAASDAAGGIPLSLLRFLGVLHDSSVLRQRGSGGWDWDMDQLEAQALRQGSHALLERVLTRLPDATVQALEAGACLAGEFSAEHLALGLHAPLSDIIVALQPAVDQRVLLPQRPGGSTISYRFVHDRIRHSLYRGIPATQRGQIHLDLGDALLSVSQQRGGTSLLFDAADQLTKALELDHDPADPVRAATLFADAGRAANRTAAWHTAVSYLEVGLTVLPADSDSADLTWRMRIALAEAYAMCDRTGDAETILARTDRETDELLRRMEIARLRARMLVLDNRYADAVQAGLDGLRLRGHQLPAIDDVEAWREPAQAVVMRMAELMSDAAVDALVERPEMRDENAAAELSLLQAIAAPAYLFPHVLSWTVTHMVNLCLTHGNGREAPMAYAMQGLLCAMGGDVTVGHSLGRAALDLVERRGDGAQLAPVTHLCVNFIDHWTHPVEDGIPQGLSAIDSALEYGLFDYAGWLAMNAVENLFLSGDGLPRLVDRAVDLYRMTRDVARYQDAANFVAGVLHAASCLAGRIDVSRQLESQGATPQALAEGLAHYPVAAMNVRLIQLVQALVESRTADARDQARLIREGSAAMMGMHQLTEFTFFESLVLADEARTATDGDRSDLLSRIEANRDALAGWSAHCAANQEHKRRFVDAELAALRGEPFETPYASAAAACTERGYLHLAALAWERCSHRHAEAGDVDAAEHRGEQAVDAYRLWGALAKVDALRSP